MEALVWQLSLDLGQHDLQDSVSVPAGRQVLVTSSSFLLVWNAELFRAGSRYNMRVSSGDLKAAGRMGFADGFGIEFVGHPHHRRLRLQNSAAVFTVFHLCFHWDPTMHQCSQHPPAKRLQHKYVPRPKGACKGSRYVGANTSRCFLERNSSKSFH